MELLRTTRDALDARAAVRLALAAALSMVAGFAMAQSAAKVDNDADVSACVRVGGQVCKTVRDLELCNAWHEEHAAAVGADTVVIADSDERGQVFGFIGKRSEVHANYYNCKTPEAITSPPEDWDRESWKYESYLAEGVTAITGQAFLRQRGGGVVTCAGSTVVAVPVGFFFDRLTEQSFQMLHPSARALIKQTTCDAGGNFRFSKLPQERWRVMTRVTWEAAVRYDPVQGGVLSRVVESSAEPEPVYLTDADRVH